LEISELLLSSVLDSADKIYSNGLSRLWTGRGAYY